MKLLVTGGSGHLGANLIRRLVANGERVVALSRPGSNNSALDGLPIERVSGDLRSADDMTRAMRGVTRVYHCAAKVSTTAGGEREIYDCNVIGTKNLLAAALAAKVERVVVTSSFSAVGHTEGRPADERDLFYPFEEHMPYERSKAWVEHECLKAVIQGLDVVIATSCAILGPADFKPSRMGRLVQDFANGKLRAYIPGGFEFVAADDIVQGHLLAMEKGKTGEKYIISTRFVTVDELVEVLEKITGKKRPTLRLPPGVMARIAVVSSFVLTNFFPDVPQRFTPGAVRILGMARRADTGKAQRELGYRPTSIEEALKQAYEFHVAQGSIVGVSPGRPAPAPRPAAAPEKARISGAVLS
ncbi:MAG: NAD-dependent epimerase/dehydratase family protein [Byssovorax sp.]